LLPIWVAAACLALVADIPAAASVRLSLAWPAGRAGKLLRASLVSSFAFRDKFVILQPQLSYSTVDRFSAIARPEAAGAVCAAFRAGIHRFVAKPPSAPLTLAK